MDARQPVEASVEATIIRADGTVVPLGTVDLTSQNKVRQAWWKLIGKRRADARIREANRGL